MKYPAYKLAIDIVRIIDSQINYDFDWEKLKITNYTCTYSLIYVNDDVPELFIDTGVEAGGCQILTFF